jgi:hypothetical protein
MEDVESWSLPLRTAFRAKAVQAAGIDPFIANVGREGPAAFASIGGPQIMVAAPRARRTLELQYRNIPRPLWPWLVEWTV